MSEAPWTIGRLLNWTADFLRERGADSPRLDAEVLLAHARGCPRIALYTAFEEPASEELRTQFRELVKQRAAGKPHIEQQRDAARLAPPPPRTAAPLSPRAPAAADGAARARRPP